MSLVALSAELSRSLDQDIAYLTLAQRSQRPSGSSIGSGFYRDSQRPDECRIGCGNIRRSRYLRLTHKGSYAALLVGIVFVGEVPDAQVTRLDPDDHIRTTESLHVRGAFLRADIPGRDAQRRL